jgi:aromatic ring-opening dioxygenase catalytic subunit (LigB family)
MDEVDRNRLEEFRQLRQEIRQSEGHLVPLFILGGNWGRNAVNSIYLGGFTSVGVGITGPFILE